MFKKSIFLYLLFFVFPSLVLAQAAPQKLATDLPNISVIGNFVGEHSQTKKAFDVQELEFAFQSYLYPGVKVDVFSSIHKEGHESHLELEEGYVTFFNIGNTFAPNYLSNLGLGAIVGKKLIAFGKENPLHPEQSRFINRSFSTQYFLGGQHGLAGEGLSFQYLLPLPFFSQLDAGYVQVPHSETSDSIPYADAAQFARLWNSVPLGSSLEFETGLNYLGSQTKVEVDHDGEPVLVSKLAALYGLDLTLTGKKKGRDFYFLRTELYHATYGPDALAHTGGFVSALIAPSKTTEFGVRYAFLGLHPERLADEAETPSSSDVAQSQWSFIASKKLTETSKFRLQYSFGNRSQDSVILAQFVFGMGPHAHVLQ